MFISLFFSLLSFQMTQDLTVVWRADLLPRQLEEMLERVTVADILPAQDSLSMKALGRAAGDGRGMSWQRLWSPVSLLSSPSSLIY